jgi:outer membrane protein
VRTLSVLILLAATCAAQPQPAMKLTLAEAHRLAIQNNPQFSAAKLYAAAAYQVPVEYKANFSPNFFGSVTGVGADTGTRLAAGGLNNPVVYNRIGTGVSVSQLLTDFGRTSHLVAMADLKAKAQDQITEVTRAQILLATDRAYFAVLRGQALLKVAHQTVDARQLVVDQVTALAESKLKSLLDVSFAGVNLADAKLLLVQSLNDLQAAQTDLATAIGLPNETAFSLSEEPLPMPLPDRIDGLVQQALTDRAELRDLRLEQSAAERFIKAEHALNFPTIALAGTTGFVPTGQEQIPGHYGAVGVNVNIPIFNGGLYKARTTEAQLRARAVLQNINDLENRVKRDVRVAYLGAVTALDKVGLTAQLLKQAELALSLAQSRYELGLGSMVELSQSQLNLTSAQIANTAAGYDYQTQRSIVDFQTAALH